MHIFRKSKPGSLLPFAPVSRTEEQRRRAVSALLRIDGSSFTQAALQTTLEGCGIAALAAETDDAQTVSVRFPGVRGIPADFARLRSRIEQILPCHLAVEYRFAYLLWRELDAMFSRWTELERDCPDWETLERLGEVEA